MKKEKTMEFMENDYIVSLYSCNFSLLVTDILISHNVERTTEDSQAEKAKTIAHIVANDSIVIDGLVGKADTSAIQTYINRILQNTGVQFIVVMDMNGIRKSHPNPQK